MLAEQLFRRGVEWWSLVVKDLFLTLPQRDMVFSIDLKERGELLVRLQGGFYFVESKIQWAQQGSLQYKNEDLKQVLCSVCLAGWPWLDSRCPPKPLYHSPSSAGQGREKITKGSWVKVRTGRDHSAITVTGKTDSTWGKKLIYYQSNQSRVMRNKTKS